MILVAKHLRPAAQEEHLALHLHAARDWRGFTRRTTRDVLASAGAWDFAGELPKMWSRVDVVEINKASCRWPPQWFDLKAEKLNIKIGDGRQFLNACQKEIRAVATGCLPRRISRRTDDARGLHRDAPGDEARHGCCVIKKLWALRAGATISSHVEVQELDQSVLPVCAFTRRDGGKHLTSASDRASCRWLKDYGPFRSAQPGAGASRIQPTPE